MERRRRGEGCIYRPKGSANWWIKYHVKGKQQFESSHSPDRKKAEKLLREKLSRRAKGELLPAAEKLYFEEMANSAVTDYTVNKKRSIKRLKEALDHLRGFFVGYKALAITTDVINDYIHARQEEGAANSTINRELSTLKLMFKLALRSRRLIYKPFVPMLKENNARSGFFEHSEFLALREAIVMYVRPIIIFAYYTGWRKSEILTLKWNQVDLDSCTVRLDPGKTKTGEGRVIALDGELLEVIQKQWEKRKIFGTPDDPTPSLCPYVFHRNGKPVKDLRKAWAKACNETGLTGKIFHDFRRTAVRNMVRAGVAERVAMLIAGHKTRSVFDRYHIVNEDDLRDAARKATEHAEKQRPGVVVSPIRS